MSPTQILVGALLLGVAKAQFLVSSADPSFALQPPPLHQGGFTTFSSQPVTQAFVQPSAPARPVHMAQPSLAPLPIVRQQQNSGQPHHAVVRNSEDEARLPAELRNDFYKDPRIAEGLAKESWFTAEEMQVFDREAEKIPRDQVFKLLKNAGLARRR